MSLKSQDVVVLLKLAVSDGEKQTFDELAAALGLSQSQAFASVKRLGDSGLVNLKTRKVHRRALAEFLIHGVKYVFPAKRGGVVRGLATAHTAPPLKGLIVGGDPVVWPDPKGDVRGESLEPLWKSVPFAARQDSKLYECLALVDALRSGRARERAIAATKLQELVGA